MSDYKGVALMLPAMPKAKQLLADKGCDADWFRAALAKRRIAACIPSKYSEPKHRVRNRRSQNRTRKREIRSKRRLWSYSYWVRSGKKSPDQSRGIDIAVYFRSIRIDKLYELDDCGASPHIRA